jgi:Type I restriction enzyme R protein N terminus (HSDR_N)
LIEIIKVLYEVEPKLFVRLNEEQKKTFVRLLNLILDSGQRQDLFNIIQEVVELDPSEREEMSRLLKKTQLSNIIQTIKLVEDRCSAIQDLKTLLKPDFGANELQHVQKFIEAHYWIFGEQYQLVTAAEPDFEEALRRHTYLLRGTKNKIKVCHPDKNKEMDIFMCRQKIDDKDETIENIVVELKNPKIKLGKKELDQVELYMRTILNTPEFNAYANNKWSFILVGNDFHQTKHESKPHIQSQIDQLKTLGERSLVRIEQDMNYKIYVKKWSEITTEFEIKHKFLLDKLKIKRQRIQEAESPDQIISNLPCNSAIASPEVSIPS